MNVWMNERLTSRLLDHYLPLNQDMLKVLWGILLFYSSKKTSTVTKIGSVVNFTTLDLSIKISSQSIQNFLSNIAYRQINKQTNGTKNITSFAEEDIIQTCWCTFFNYTICDKFHEQQELCCIISGGWSIYRFASSFNISVYKRGWVVFTFHIWQDPFICVTAAIIAVKSFIVVPSCTVNVKYTPSLLHLWLSLAAFHKQQSFFSPVILLRFMERVWMSLNKFKPLNTEHLWLKPTSIGWTAYVCIWCI